MIIIALFIFLIGIAIEEYIYGFIFAILIYLFDSNRKLQSRVSLLETNNLKPKPLTQENSPHVPTVDTQKDAHLMNICLQ
ncbi:hypothetical protein CJF42_12790 [Pseudoalteromonas sp. NBT06-2]|uniref:hypothetical protein n=1 Tax=Pseudoalteromonas sp. NBT06-2 TaxID=2025950 RepID=UPI000BA7894D|nr:hypothetical protein [Pseudoalteromonas sp. NBT06-2]PAJ74020.1 hypothetical protein CJF42_12790 [Pseudoalteromonas sp. NBT06-2]